MADFHLVTYVLVILWIQKCVNGEDRMSIRANTTTVSPREPYTIVCQTVYSKLWLLKNNDYIVNEKCEVLVNKKEYRCSSTKYKTDHVVRLTVLNGEENLGTVNWECRFGTVTRQITIRVRNTDPSTTTTTRKPSSTIGTKTSPDKPTGPQGKRTTDSTEERTTDRTEERTTDRTEERTTDRIEERTDRIEERTIDSTNERSADSRMLTIFFDCLMTLMLAVNIAFVTLVYRKFMVLEKHFKRFAAKPSDLPTIDVHTYESLQKTDYETMDSK